MATIEMAQLPYLPPKDIEQVKSILLNTCYSLHIELSPGGGKTESKGSALENFTDLEIKPENILQM